MCASVRVCIISMNTWYGRRALQGRLVRIGRACHAHLGCVRQQQRHARRAAHERRGERCVLRGRQHRVVVVNATDCTERRCTRSPATPTVEADEQLPKWHLHEGARAEIGPSVTAPRGDFARDRREFGAGRDRAPGLARNTGKDTRRRCRRGRRPRGRGSPGADPAPRGRGRMSRERRSGAGWRAPRGSRRRSPGAHARGRSRRNRRCRRRDTRRT